MASEVPSIQIGMAGWSNPPATRSARHPGQSHLAYYATLFSCVEINSSFYRPHQQATYARWRAETPQQFRFSVKMPRSITHESHLKRCAKELARFYAEIAHLQPKLAAVLIQLPPSLQFDRRTARVFFKNVPSIGATKIVCEPRHESWFTLSADALLRDLGVSRAAADPPKCGGAECPGGALRFAYFRWHGSPRVYYSKYSDTQLARFAKRVDASKAPKIWCVFDNTARYAAWEDALRFKAALGRVRSAECS